MNYLTDSLYSKARSPSYCCVVLLNFCMLKNGGIMLIVLVSYIIVYVGCIAYNFKYVIIHQWNSLKCGSRGGSSCSYITAIECEIITGMSL